MTQLNWTVEKRKWSRLFPKRNGHNHECRK